MVEEVVALLRRCEDPRADRLERLVAGVRAGQPDAVRHVQRLLAGGMGSLHDTDLHPPPGAGISQAEASERLANLIAEFDDARSDGEPGPRR